MDTIRASLSSLVVLFSVGLFASGDPGGGGTRETLLNGDSNCDGNLDLSDAVHLLAFLYLGAGPPCPLANPPDADRLDLLQRIVDKEKEADDLSRLVSDLENQLRALEVDLAAKVAELAQAAERLAAREAELQAQCDTREAELQAALVAKDVELNAKAEEIAACEEDLEWWKATHWEECRNRLDRFVRNGDGTVTDICTGLMWQQSVADLDGDGLFNLDNAESEFPIDKADWSRAKGYAEALSLGGHDDWRLPEVEEMAALNQDPTVTLATAEFGCLPPAFQAPSCCQPAVTYWTATPYDLRVPTVPQLAWAVWCSQSFLPLSVWVQTVRKTREPYLVLAVRDP